MSVFFLDPENGNDASDGLSFANRWKTLTSGATAARIAPGDTIRIMASPDPTSLGQSASWTNLSKTVTLTSAVTANIDDGEVAWTASANVTSTADTTQFKENTKSAKHVIAAGFTTGLASYKALGGATDFSAYKQVSFWIRNSVAIPNGTSLSIRLCSDAVGVTTVDTIAIPAIPSVNQWVPITVDKAAALGASIQSVALYVDSDFGAVDIYLDNIIACKDSTLADSLSLTSMIGKNTAGEIFYPIQSINGTTIKIDNTTNTLGNAGRGYSGTTESVTTWKRQIVKRDMVAVASTNIDAINDSGTAGNLINFEGGWNRTDMSTQTGETWWDGQNGMGELEGVNRLYCRYNKLFLVRFDRWNLTGFGMSIGDIGAIGCTNTGSFGIGTGIAENNGTLWVVNCGGGANIHKTSCPVKLVSRNNNGDGHATGLAEVFATFKDSYFVNNGDYGIDYTSNNSSSVCILELINCVSSDNATAFINPPVAGEIRMFNCLISDATEVSPQSQRLSRVISVKHDQVAGNHFIFTAGCQIASEGTIRHTASGIAWKLPPANSDITSVRPLFVPVARVTVAANALVTCKLWMRRTNVALTGQLVCRGGQIAGVSADVVASMTVAADTWEEVTITFTPTESGVVEIEAWAFGGTTHSLYVDDVSPTQA